MKLVSKQKVFTGITILIVLAISYFIKITADTGANYETTDSLLGALIFHNPFMLLVYLAIAAACIVTGIKKIKII